MTTTLETDELQLAERDLSALNSQAAELEARRADAVGELETVNEAILNGDTKAPVKAGQLRATVEAVSSGLNRLRGMIGEKASHKAQIEAQRARAATVANLRDLESAVANNRAEFADKTAQVVADFEQGLRELCALSNAGRAAMMDLQKAVRLAEPGPSTGPLGDPRSAALAAATARLRAEGFDEDTHTFALLCAEVRGGASVTSLRPPVAQDERNREFILAAYDRMALRVATEATEAARREREQ